MSRILYNNALRGAAILTEDTITNYGFSNALNGITGAWAGFLVGDGRDTDFDLGVATEVDSLAVARHNGGTVLATVSVYGSNDNITYSAFLSQSFGSSNKVQVFSFSPVSYRYYRVRFLSTTGDVFVSDVFLGKSLKLERSQKHGFIRPDFADGDQVIANITRGENLSGLSVSKAPRRVKFQLFYYSESFFAEWESFVNTAKQYPVYVAWNDSQQPFYCWPTKKIPEPAYSKNINGYYSVTLDMSGFIE